MKSALRPIRTVLRYAALTMATAVVLAALSLCSAIVGCVTDPDTGAVRIDPAIRDAVTNALASVAESDARTEEAEDAANAGGGAVAEADAEPETRPASSAEPAAFSADWRFGGFKGGGAKEDSRCRIGSPTITKDKISWRWETKIPSDWKRGSTSKGPMVISAAFYWDETARMWVGGKMDWCDEARTSRDTDKIHGGYNGWQSAGWDKAKRRAFCVVSADGKWRSNVLED